MQLPRTLRRIERPVRRCARIEQHPSFSFIRSVSHQTREQLRRKPRHKLYPISTSSSDSKNMRTFPAVAILRKTFVSRGTPDNPVSVPRIPSRCRHRGNSPPAPRGISVASFGQTGLSKFAFDFPAYFRKASSFNGFLIRGCLDEQTMLTRTAVCSGLRRWVHCDAYLHKYL